MRIGICPRMPHLFTIDLYAIVGRKGALAGATIVEKDRPAWGVSRQPIDDRVVTRPPQPKNPEDLPWLNAEIRVRGHSIKHLLRFALDPS